MATYLAVVLGGFTALPIAHFIIDSISPMVPIPNRWWVPLPSARAQQLGVGTEWDMYAKAVRGAEGHLADHIQARRVRGERDGTDETMDDRDAVRAFSDAVQKGRACFLRACCRRLHQQSEIRRVWSQMAAEVAPRFPEGGDYRLVDEQGGETGLVIGVVDGRVCVRGCEADDVRGPDDVDWHDLTIGAGVGGPCLGATGLRPAGQAASLDLAVDIRTQKVQVIAAEGTARVAHRGTLKFLASP